VLLAAAVLVAIGLLIPLFKGCVWLVKGEAVAPGGAAVPAGANGARRVSAPAAAIVPAPLEAAAGGGRGSMGRDRGPSTAMGGSRGRPVYPR
jgi:hypothetical protein